MAFFRIISSCDAVLPYKFYSLFELSRLELREGKICATDDNQKRMIIIFYLLVKILLKQVLCETTGVKSPNVRKNLKMIASVYLHSILDHFKSTCGVKGNINKELAIKNQIEGESGDFTEMKDKRGVHRGYVFAVNKYAKKKAARNSAGEKVLLNKISKGIPPLTPDDDCNDVEFITRNLYKHAELETYFEVAKQSGFDVTDRILIFANKIVGLMDKGKK